MYLLEEDAGRWRIVVDAAPADRRLFEARIPKDATLAELEAFFAEVAGIMRKRRANEVTKRERPP